MQSELSNVQVSCYELCQAWFWHSSMWLSVFLQPWRWVRTFLVLLLWNCLRKCPLTMAIQLGDEKWASVRPPFLGPSPCGASSAVPKESCLAIQGAAGWCCRLRSTSDNQYPELPACRIGTVASSEIFHLLFCPFPNTTGLGSVGGIMDMDLSFQPAQFTF